MSTEDLQPFIGKTISSAIQTYPVDSILAQDVIELRFTDGSGLMLVSRDYEGYSSWIDVIDLEAREGG